LESEDSKEPVPVKPAPAVKVTSPLVVSFALSMSVS